MAGFSPFSSGLGSTVASLATFVSLLASVALPFAAVTFTPLRVFPVPVTVKPARGAEGDSRGEAGEVERPPSVLRRPKSECENRLSGINPDFFGNERVVPVETGGMFRRASGAGKGGAGSVEIMRTVMLSVDPFA